MSVALSPCQCTRMLASLSAVASRANAHPQLETRHPWSQPVAGRNSFKEAMTIAAALPPPLPSRSPTREAVSAITSPKTNPDYRRKLDALRAVLSNLNEDEAFFSIDEFGPFAADARRQIALRS